MDRGRVRAAVGLSVLASVFFALAYRANEDWPPRLLSSVLEQLARGSSNSESESVSRSSSIGIVSYMER